MAEYIENGYIESGYIEGDTSTTPTVATCDLTSLLSEFNDVDLSIATLDTKVNHIVGVLNLMASTVSTLNSKTNSLLNTIHSSTSEVILEVQALTSGIALPSLNGNGSEYKDGTLVTVVGRNIVYSVNRSYYSLYMDNGYTVHYDLISDDGYKLTVPEALLTKYVVAV